MPPRPIAHRDMTVRSPREIAARLAFALYVTLPPLGGLLLLRGLTGPSPIAGWLGAAALVGFAGLHLRGHRALGFGALVQELRRNPFKPLRPPPGTAAPTARDERGTGGLL